MFWTAGLLLHLHTLIASPASDIKRRITLSLGYDEAFNSNEGMKHLPLTSIQGYSWVFDQVAKMTCGSWSRFGLVCADIILHIPYLGKSFLEHDSNWFLKEKWWPYLPAYHEFGHARAMRAFSKEGFEGYKVTAKGGSDHKEGSVLWYYIHAFKQGALIEDAQTYGPNTVRRPTQILTIYAGGLNNEARLCKEIANVVYRFNGHIAYFGPYLRGKVAPISYTAKTISKVISDDVGDINYIWEYYKSYYPEFKLACIQYGGWASLLLSSSTYAFLKGYWDFIQTGNPIVRTFTWNGIRIPDVNFYFTRNGLSLEVVSGYQINPNLDLTLGIETVYYPHFSSVELTPGIRYTLPTKEHGTFEFDLGLVINRYGYFAGHIGLEWTDPINPFTLETKVIYHNANTYLGERNITYSRKTDTEIEFALAASFNY